MLKLSAEYPARREPSRTETGRSYLRLDAPAPSSCRASIPSLSLLTRRSGRRTLTTRAYPTQGSLCGTRLGEWTRTLNAPNDALSGHRGVPKSAIADGICGTPSLPIAGSAASHSTAGWGRCFGPAEPLTSLLHGINHPAKTAVFHSERAAATPERPWRYQGDKLGPDAAGHVGMCAAPGPEVRPSADRG